MKDGCKIPKTSAIAKLAPYVDGDYLLHVNGCLRSVDLDLEEKHPLIIHRTDHVTLLLARHYHSEVKHQGRHLTEGAIRAAGFWIVGGKHLVSSVIYQCVLCRKLRGRENIQKMADLPADRLEPGPPFSNVGLDTFGPWSVVAHRTRGG